MYAPCNAAQRKRLWRRLSAVLDPNIDWFSDGDWNFVELLEDILGGGRAGVTRVPLEWHELRDVCLQAADPWVTLPAHKKRDLLKHSWTNKREGGGEEFRARRLDRWYVPIRWMHKVDSYGIIPTTNLADHASVFLLFNLVDVDPMACQPKLDVWRRNLEHLQDKEVGEKIKGLWQQQEQDLAKRGVAKLLKAMEDTKNLLRRYGAQKAKERRV